MLIFSLVFTAIMPLTMIGFALIYIQLVILLLVIPITERALKKTFDKNGNRR